MKASEAYAYLFIVLSMYSLMVSMAFADNAIELQTTTIKGNTELPKYLYVVPWQDRTEVRTGEQEVVLHNLYSDLFDPVLPTYVRRQTATSVIETELDQKPILPPTVQP